jgi:transposase
MEAFVSVYVDMAASADSVRAAVAELPKPKGVFDVTVDCNSVTDTFGCRIAVDLTGTFDEQAEGLAIARRYAEQLSRALGVPAFPFYDLLRRDHPAV